MIMEESDPMLGAFHPPSRTHKFPGSENFPGNKNNQRYIVDVNA